MPIKRKDENNDDAESVNSSSTCSNSANRNSSKKIRTSNYNKTSGSGVSTNLNEQLKHQPAELAREFYDFLRNYRNQNGRLVCENFIRLPTKRTNLDYYTTIKQPIDFIKIQQRLRTDDYQTFQQFDNDIQLLISNAKQFYKKGSPEHNDAIELDELYSDEKKKKSIETTTSQSQQQQQQQIVADLNSADSNKNKSRNKSKSSLDSVGSGGGLGRNSKKNAKDGGCGSSEADTTNETNTVDNESENEEHEEDDNDENNDENENEQKTKLLDEIKNELKENLPNEQQTTVKKRGRPASNKSSPVKSNQVKSTPLPPPPTPAPTATTSGTQHSLPIKKRVDLAENQNEEKSLNLYLEDYFDIICSYQDDSQRYLANIFYLLPSQKEYPDYYETIKKTIDLKQVARKILSSTYKSLKQMESDLNLMMDNAKRYNEPKSIIYKDACKLKNLARTTCKELTDLQQQAKLCPSTKNREKKRKLISEIAETDEDDFNQLVQNNLQVLDSREEEDGDGDSNEEEDDDEEDDNDDDDDDEEEEEEEEEEATTKKGKTKPIKNEAISNCDSDSNDASIQIESNNRSGRRSQNKTNQQLMTTMWSLFDFIKDFKDTKTHQTIIDPFVKLPSKRTYPDYYEEIKSPIALNLIKKKLNKRSYRTIRELVDDFELMFKNAMQYNLEESLIYEYASKLLNALHLKSGELSLSINTSMVNSASASPAISLATPNKKQTNQHSSGARSTSSSHHQQQQQQQPQRLANLVEHNIKRLFKMLMDYCGGEEDAVMSSSKHQSSNLGSSSSSLTGGGGTRNLSKRMLSLSFMQLPSKDQQPDYYEKVKDPIDFDTIKKRIDTNSYSSESEMISECMRVLNNAKLFYNESSQLYKDAQKLFNYLTSRYQLFLSRQSLNYELASDETSNSSFNNIKQQVGAAATAASTAVSSSNSLIPKFSDLKEKLIYLYNYILDYQLNERELAYPFRVLPSKTEYPDYYTIIKKPIDMNKIWHKINQHGHVNSYSSIDEMCVDFAQMFENACTYNEPNSTIYKDALNLQRALFVKRDEIVNSELNTTFTSSNCFSKDPVNDYQNEIDFIKNNEFLPSDFVSNAIQSILEYIFESCMQYQDTEGRCLSETFIDLYNIYDRLTKTTNNESSSQQNETSFILTFDLIRKRLKERVYKRLDVFQDEMFQVFDQVRKFSYLESTENNDEPMTKCKLHRYSQLYKDAYDLQRYFIQKRDETCRNGDLLQSAAMSFKLSTLDAHIASLLNTSNSQTFDESEALLVEQRYKRLESILNGTQSDTQTTSTESNRHLANYQIGFFYYMNRSLIKSNLIDKDQCCVHNEQTKTTQPLVVCVLNTSPTKDKMIVQVYLRPNIDDEFIDENLKKTRRFFNQEIFKSDLYALIDLKSLEKEEEHQQQQAPIRQCYVIGIKDFISNEISLSVTPSSSSSTNQTKNDLDQTNNEPSTKLNKEDLFICESIYSTRNKYFRKLLNKKWSPLAFLNSTNLASSSSTTTTTTATGAAASSSSSSLTITFTKRSIPLIISRHYQDESFVNELVVRVDKQITELSKLKELFKGFSRHTIEYDSAPPSATTKDKDADDYETSTDDHDPELMKTAKYYEQLLYKDGELYKLGDYVYVKNNQQNVDSKLPMIVRIDRLWSTRINETTNNSTTKFTTNYYLKGPLFLRSIEVPHEPTRLFYKNEVFKELSREITVPMENIVSSDNNPTNNNKKKCVVMNVKKYVSCRPTEIDERDVYVCEVKYSTQQKTFRKFTKGLRKFELSVKCSEDDVYFFRRELQLRKHLSPLLVDMNINYEEENSTGLDSNNLEQTQTADAELNASNDDDWSDGMRDDENSSHSFGINNAAANSNESGKQGVVDVQTNPDGSVKIKKIRVKRLKKTGYNLFSKEFRKRLRDTKSSLSFINMSKEVGNRWRALTDKERAEYEEKAKLESIKKLAESNATSTSTTTIVAPAGVPNQNISIVQQQQQYQQQQQQQQQQQLANFNQIQNAQIILSPHPQGGQLIQSDQSFNTILTNQIPVSALNVASNQIFINSNQGIIQSTNGSQTYYIQQTPNGLVTKQAPLVIYPNQQSQVPIQIQQAQPQMQTLQPLQHQHQHHHHHQHQQQQAFFNIQQTNSQNVYQPVYNEQSTSSNQTQIPAQQQQLQQPQKQHQHHTQQPLRQENPKQVFHRESYIRYIANMRKQQQLHQSNNIPPTSTIITPDWYNSLDIRSSRIKESKVMPPPSSWIENCSTNDVLQHLVSLRYYLLNDAINIQQNTTSHLISQSSELTKLDETDNNNQTSENS